VKPISTKREAQFKGPSSSKDYNAWMEEVSYDINQLFETATRQSATIPLNTALLCYENIFLQKRINELEDMFSNIVFNSTSTSSKSMIRSFYNTENILSVTDYEQVSKNPSYGMLMAPPLQELSKMYLIDTTGETHIPKSLAYSLYESYYPMDITVNNMIDISSVTKVEDTAMVNIFDGNDETFWYRKVTTDTSTNEIYFCLDISLPTDIINHTRANMIFINPTPLSCVDILDIQYSTLSGWQRISTYPTTVVAGKPYPLQIEDAGNMHFVSQR
jgi:hypothetical protein